MVLRLNRQFIRQRLFQTWDRTLRRFNPTPQDFPLPLAWFYAGDTSHLWTNPVDGGSHTGTPTDSGLVGVWQDKYTPGGHSLAFSGSAGATANQPHWFSSTGMYLPSLYFDGGDSLNAINNTLSTYQPLSAFVGAANKTIIFALRLTAAGTNSANIYDNTGILSDSGGYFGLHLKTVSGTHTLYAYNWDGNADSAGVTVSLDTDYVVMIRHNGSSLSLSVLSGALGVTRSDANTSSGATSNVTGTLRLAKNYASAMWTGYIGEIYLSNCCLSSTNAVLTDFVSRWLPGTITYTATAGCVIGAVTATGSGTFVPPTYTGASTCTVGALTLNSTGTFVGTTYTGTSATTIGSLFLQAIGTFVVPTYSGSATLTIGPQTFVGVANFSSPTYLSTFSGSLGAITFSSSGMFTAPAYSGTVSIILGAGTISASGSVSAPNYSAIASLQVGSEIFSGAAIVTSPQYSATSDLVVTPSILTGSGQVIVPVFSSSGNLLNPTVVLNSSGTNTPPSFSATSSIVLAPEVLLAAAQHIVPSYSAEAAAVLPAVDIAASGSFLPPTFSSYTELQVSKVIFSGLSNFEPLSYTGSIVTILPSIVLQGQGQFAVSSVIAVSQLTLPPILINAIGQFSEPVYIATAGFSVAQVQIAVIGAFIKPQYTSASACTLGSVLIVVTASAAPPEYAGETSLAVGTIVLNGVVISYGKITSAKYRLSCRIITSDLTRVQINAKIYTRKAHFSQSAD